MPKRKLTIGILAHVDAGKTTLCEGLLFASGAIRSRGRVDHGDAYLDNFELEKQRGITIFAKQARFSTEAIEVNLIDTPGHVDFSTEAERILAVLDYAVLVISGSEGVQAHTETLWKLLRSYNVPTFIFINKMDLPAADKGLVMAALNKRISESCVDFSEAGAAEFYEEVAMTDEELLDDFVEGGSIADSRIALAVRQERLFPCYFGSALKLEGVGELLKAFQTYTLDKHYPDEFAARVFKISRDSQGARLTHLKLTGGSLSVRDEIAYTVRNTAYSEKITRIRLYSGAGFEQVGSVTAGDVCAVLGLSSTFPGQTLGIEEGSYVPMLEPVLNYRIRLPEGVDAQTALPLLRQLEEEDPSLGIVWNEQHREIHARLMGEIQIEVLKSLIKDRFDMDVEIDNGRIMYRETILSPIEGIGHYEPLRHYAEVHLLMEPLPAGSGLVFGSSVSTDALDLNWQRLILTHLYEKTHLGVLTGSPITDMRITLVAGLASIKHTEGGDFRQATYRAVRQGLMRAECALLEPYYSFEMELPINQLGRACNDIRLMGGTFSSPQDDGENAFISGTAPVSAMREYAVTLAAYTKGRGRLSCCVSHYARCKEEKKIIDEIGYDPEADIENTPDSIFCSHGAGVAIKWNRVEEYMHFDTELGLNPGSRRIGEQSSVERSRSIEDRELESIMLREFGPIKRPEYGKRPKPSGTAPETKPEISIPKKPERPDYLIVDGYNIIFGWSGLRELAESDVAAARKRLMDIMANYRGYKKNEVVLVFDGYRVKGNAGERFNYHGIRVAYTRENETADNFIERLIAEIGKNYAVRVASSDGLIQLSSVRTGVLRMTAAELEREVDGVNERLHELMESMRRKKVSVKIELPDIDDKCKEDEQDKQE